MRQTGSNSFALSAKNNLYKTNSQ